MIKILLALTFVYGVLRLITYLNIFKLNLVGILESVFPTKDNTFINDLFSLLDMWMFYFSLVFQAWYWIVKFNI